MIDSADVCDLSLSHNAKGTATGKAIRESAPKPGPSMTAGELTAMSATEPHSITGLIRSSSRPRVPLYYWPGLQTFQATAAIAPRAFPTSPRALPPSLAACTNQTTEHNPTSGPHYFTTRLQTPAHRQTPTHRHSGAGRNPHPVPMGSGLHRNDGVGRQPVVSLPEDC